MTTSTINHTTTAEIDAQIAALRAEVQALETRRTAIDSEIAQNWQGDTSELELEAARIDARVRGSRGVFEKLDAMREEAAHREALANYKVALVGLIDATKTYHKADKALAAIFNKALEVYGQYEQASQAHSAAFSMIGQTRRTAEQLNVDRAALDELMNTHTPPDAKIESDEARRALMISYEQYRRNQP